MRTETLVVVFSLVSFFYGLYMLLTVYGGPRPGRRFLIGLICLLGGAAIAGYQLTHL